MSMNREEAYELLKRDFDFMLAVAIETAHGEKSDIKEAKQIYKDQMQALSILAPEPRKEPPTVDEVGDEEWCMGQNRNNGRWDSCTGAWIRHNWYVWYDAWLPLSALPMPKGGE